MVGRYPGDQNAAVARRKLEALLDLGVRHVINLMQESECGYDGQRFLGYADLLERLALDRGVPVLVTRVPVADITAPRRESVAAVLDLIDHSLARGRPVFVHCRGGIGRAATIAGCFLAHRGLAVGEAALHRIETLREQWGASPAWSPEADDQREMVRRWKPAGASG